MGEILDPKRLSIGLMINQNVLDFNDVGVFQEENHISRTCRGVLDPTLYLWGKEEAALPTGDGGREAGGG